MLNEFKFAQNITLLSEKPENNTVGYPFIEIESVESTNNYAMQLVQKGNVTHGTVVFAYKQTKGKGQRSKQWFTEAGKNIIMSAILKISVLYVFDQFRLSVATILAMHDFFKHYAKGNLSVKWPNDLYWCDRKAGGLLIESIIQGKNWQWSVAGIGININQVNFDNKIANAVSLKQITGKDENAVDLAKELCRHLSRRYNNLPDNSDKDLKEYNHLLYKRGEKIRLKKDNAVFECILKEINAAGELVVNGAIDRIFKVGEVEWLH